jgi:hypothetical protein
MKEIWKNGVVVLLIIAVLYIIFLRECKKPAPCPAKDEIIIPLSTWNKIQELANKPAITHIDTVYLKGKTIYVYKELPIAVPNPKDTTVNSYSDSLIRKDIDVIYDFSVRGDLLSRSWTYKPIITEVFRTDSIFVPQIVEMPVKVPIRGLFGYISAGGNADSFLFGGGLDFITKKNTVIGYQYQRFGSDNFHSVKIGVKLFTK